MGRVEGWTVGRLDWVVLVLVLSNIPSFQLPPSSSASARKSHSATIAKRPRIPLPREWSRAKPAWPEEFWLTSGSPRSSTPHGGTATTESDASELDVLRYFISGPFKAQLDT